MGEQKQDARSDDDTCQLVLAIAKTADRRRGADRRQGTRVALPRRVLGPITLLTGPETGGSAILSASSTNPWSLNGFNITEAVSIERYTAAVFDRYLVTLDQSAVIVEFDGRTDAGAQVVMVLTVTAGKETAQSDQRRRPPGATSTVVARHELNPTRPTGLAFSS